MKLMDWVRKALTRQVVVPVEEERTRAVRLEEVAPSERLVLAVVLTVAAVVLMAVLEVVHVVYLGVWNGEVFSALASLVGLVVGTLIGARM